MRKLLFLSSRQIYKVNCSMISLVILTQCQHVTDRVTERQIDAVIGLHSAY